MGGRLSTPEREADRQAKAAIVSHNNAMLARVRQAERAAWDRFYLTCCEGDGEYLRVDPAFLMQAWLDWASRLDHLEMQVFGHRVTYPGSKPRTIIEAAFEAQAEEDAA